MWFYAGGGGGKLRPVNVNDGGVRGAEFVHVFEGGGVDFPGQDQAGAARFGQRGSTSPAWFEMAVRWPDVHIPDTVTLDTWRFGLAFLDKEKAWQLLS